eukprot:TRINITY_DN16267_c0_g1_i1.p1 TRINITY_DN16267_c0_g1~~TRINITY_DN16267_c0_g1_i1.p1  ORF type:complete len:135 (-),score=10.23 TRINITY_DN16267_c0_g1_i1:99-503(-)
MLPVIEPPPGLPYPLEQGADNADFSEAADGHDGYRMTVLCAFNAIFWGSCSNTAAMQCSCGCCGAHCYDVDCPKHGGHVRIVVPRYQRLRRRGRKSRRCYNHSRRLAAMATDDVIADGIEMISATSLGGVPDTN